MLSVERVRAELTATRFGDVRVLADVDSTNRVVRELADEGAAEGVVVIAEHQSAGRGRLGRTWEAPPGSAVLMSILVRPRLAVTELHLVTAAVALSARAACGRVGGFRPDLKWPNDLLVGEAKLAGILAEASLGAVVVGIGLNVSAAPAGAVCVDDLAGRRIEREDLVAEMLADLDRRMVRWGNVIADYRVACATIGLQVRVITPAGEMLGRADGVDDQGRLMVTPDHGAPVVLAAADVTHLRSR